MYVYQARYTIYPDMFIKHVIQYIHMCLLSTLYIISRCMFTKHVVHYIQMYVYLARYNKVLLYFKLLFLLYEDVIQKHAYKCNSTDLSEFILSLLMLHLFIYKLLR